ncbi:MAG: hypothetical protein KGO05_10570, partial [Chloroflexota bacterium]|nr:hypothetical protein [Chloroflexota bacterium]
MAKRVRKATAKRAAPQDAPAFTQDASGDDFDAPPPDDDAPLPDHEPWEEVPDWQADDPPADIADDHSL